MATVSLRTRERKKGRVYELVINRVIGGIRKREYRALPVGTTKALALKIANQVQMEIELGEYVEKNSITFREYADTYLELYCKNLSPSTYHSYVGLLNSVTGINSWFGDVPIQKIDNESIQRYVNYISEDCKKTPKTCRNVVNLMHLILKKAVIQKYIRSNPAENIEMPRRKRPETHAYSLDEVSKLLERSKDDITLHAIIGLGCLAGLRRSEMCALKISNIILSDEKNEIQIRENIVKFDKTVYTREGKTHNSIRDIPIPDTLVDILKRANTDYKVRKLKYGEAFKDTEGQLLAYEDGSFRDPQGIYKVYNKFIRKQEDLPHYTLHQLRHTYASIMVNLGVNPKIIQENLGHADMTTTLNVYTHTYSKTKQMEAKRLDEALKMAK